MHNHAGGGGRHAAFQMFDMMVHRQHKEAKRFCCLTEDCRLTGLLFFYILSPSAGAFLLAIQWLRTENWRPIHHFSVSEIQLHGCKQQQAVWFVWMPPGASHTALHYLVYLRVKPGPKWDSAHPLIPPPASEPCIEPEWTQCWPRRPPEGLLLCAYPCSHFFYWGKACKRKPDLAVRLRLSGNL